MERSFAFEGLRLVGLGSWLGLRDGIDDGVQLGLRDGMDGVQLGLRDGGWA